MARTVTRIAIDQFPIRQMFGKIYTKMGRTISFLPVLFSTAGECLYLFMNGMVREKNRWLIREIRLLVSSRLFPRQYVTSVEITSLVPSWVSVRLCEQVYVWGNIDLNELLVLVELLQALQPAACFEIGTFDGRTTLNMAANTPQEAVIYTLDLPRQQIDRTALPLHSSDLDWADKEMSGTRYRSTEWEHKIQQLYGDSATFDYAPYQGKIDFVFIDGSHAYEYVLSDSRNAIALLRGGQGIILWHDYTTWPSVRKAIDYLRKTDPRFANTRYIDRTSFACLICG